MSGTTREVLPVDGARTPRTVTAARRRPSVAMPGETV